MVCKRSPNTVYFVFRYKRCREVKDSLPKAFHLTLFRGNRQNKAEMKPSWIIKRKAEFSLAERSKPMIEKIKKFLKSRRILFVYTEGD